MDHDLKQNVPIVFTIHNNTQALSPQSRMTGKELLLLKVILCCEVTMTVESAKSKHQARKKYKR